MVDHAVAALGGVDILVNCAAEAHPAPTVTSVTDAAFEADMNVKVMVYLRCARQVAPMTDRTPLGANHQRQWSACSGNRIATGQHA